MKKISFIGSLFLMILLTGCNSTKNTGDETIYGQQWELEYLSGPRIAFDALFENKKPIITFNKSEGEVVGNSGCNGYRAPFKIEKNTISFGEEGPSTMMYCGEGEKFFRNTMQKVNRYKIEDGKLNLMIDDVPMMRFHKTE